MTKRLATVGRFLTIAMVLGFACLSGAEAQTEKKAPEKVYIPYEKLKDVFESEKQGVFLPYADFQKLWAEARGAPAGAVESPLGYLISTARFTGTVSGKLAEMNLLLTVDIMSDKWTEVPIALGQVAVAKASFKTSPDPKAIPLLRVVGGKYRLLVKGKGRWVVSIDFVRQLVTKPGQNVLEYQMPSAAISTLELLIPEENMKVDVEPMLAATTRQVTAADKSKATKLKAFLGSAAGVKLSWRPRTQAAAALAPVVICSQLQHINVAEALIAHDVTFNYDIRRRGVDSFSIQLPAKFRVTAVDGANISKWDIVAGKADSPAPAQMLNVKLYSEAKGSYTLTVKMERFLKEARLTQTLTPILTHSVLRRTGLIAITHSARRSADVTGVNKELVRVDVGRLPANLRGLRGVTAYRFTSAGYGADIEIATVAPRASVTQAWALGAAKDSLRLYGRLQYAVDRAGIFSVSMNLPEHWEVTSIGPSSIVHDYELTGKGAQRSVNITLKRELSGTFVLELHARSVRKAPDGDVEFVLPQPDAKNLHNYRGQLTLYLADSLLAEVGKLDQLQSIPVGAAGASRDSQSRRAMVGLTPAMAFEFRAIDRKKAAGASFKTSVKPAQVSAVVHRLVDIQDGSVRHEAVVDYSVRYAPVDTFYVKMPADLASEGVDISGANIKEKPLLPPDRHPKIAGDKKDDAREADDEIKWACYKIVLQSPVSGAYRLSVKWRKSYKIAGDAGPAVIDVSPVFAAGELSDQSGFIAVRKAATLAVGSGEMEDLVFGDPGSAADLPWAAHRKDAIIALRHNAAKYKLTLPVRMQKEADVYTTIANAVIVEQTLARDGTLNGRMICLLSTSRGDRLRVTMPAGAKVYPFMLDGREVAVESPSPDVRVVQLPHSAGQVARTVLEITYGLDAAAGAINRKLPAPSLPDDVPVQRTFWRVYTPEDYVVLGYDRNFAMAETYSVESLFDRVATGHQRNLGKFPSQGDVWSFSRQGAAAEFSMTLMQQEIFVAILWGGILIAGVVLLKFRGFTRAIAALVAITAAAGISQFNPLLVTNAAKFGKFACIIVLLLWMAHWVFFRLLRKRKGALPPPARPESPIDQVEPVTLAAEEGGENENA